MDKLMKFENNDVQIVEIDGEWYFDLYAVGMALGQFVTAKGKTYANKKRIDENVKNAEITPVLRNAKPFITESQVYDLMLETRTDKCKVFRKWLTNEVLPELRKNGEYSMKAERTVHRLVKPYEYVEKTYNGEPVLSSIDMEHFTGLERCTPIRYARKSLNEGTDYFDLTGKELMKYRAENHGKIGSTKAAVIFTRRGFMSVCQAYGLDVQSPNRFSSNEVRISARIKEVEIRITMLRALLDSIDNGIVTDQSAAAMAAAANDILESVEGLGAFLSDIKTEKAEIAYKPL